MFRYALRRILVLIPTLLAVYTVTFFLMRITPGGPWDTQERQLAMLWVLNLSDGEHSLLDVAERSGLDFGLVAEVAATLEEAQLLAEV